MAYKNNYMITTEIYKKRTKKYDIWIGFNDKGECTKPNYFVEVYVKTKNGIRHLVNWYHKKDPKQAIMDTEKHGFFSKRPYTLAQPCDGSIDNAVHALLYDFCKAKNLDVYELLKEAYPNEDHSDNDYGYIKTFAEWQGITYPETWDKTAFDGLIESLTEINNHSLAGVLINKFQEVF